VSRRFTLFAPSRERSLGRPPLPDPQLSFCLAYFQQLNYPMRIVHPDRSEGSLPMSVVHPEPACAGRRSEVSRYLFWINFQRLTRCLKLNYPMRIVHPERSEGSLCRSTTTFQQVTNCLGLATLSEPLCFQPLTTVKFSKSRVLMTLQQYRGWVVVRGWVGFKYYFNSAQCAAAPTKRHPLGDSGPVGEALRFHRCQVCSRSRFRL